MQSGDRSIDSDNPSHVAASLQSQFERALADVEPPVARPQRAVGDPLTGELTSFAKMRARSDKRGDEAIERAVAQVRDALR